MGDFTVIVIDASTALPVSMAFVQMRNMVTNTYWEGYTDTEGKFVATEVLAGSYWINIVKSKYQTYSITLNAGPGGALMAGLIPEGGMPPSPPPPPPASTPAGLTVVVGSLIVGFILVM